ncbi:MAG: PilW family protein [Deltaproteobacteria bacterium]
MKKYHPEGQGSDEQGFTLVEVLVAIGISGFILAGLYTSFLAQQKSYFVNERVAEMQQNLRSAMLSITYHTRMAGFDPTNNTGARILMAGPYWFRFQEDLNKDGVNDNKENITYGFSTASGFDTDGNGKADSGAANLGMATGTAATPSGFDAIAENIEAVGFAYAYENGGNTVWAIDSGSGALDLNLDRNGDGLIDKDDDQDGNNIIDSSDYSGATITAVPISSIKAVKVWILARSSLPDRDFTDTTTYVVGRNIITPTGDDTHYYHRLLVTTINLRNM